MKLHIRREQENSMLLGFVRSSFWMDFPMKEVVVCVHIGPLLDKLATILLLLLFFILYVLT